MSKAEVVASDGMVSAGHRLAAEAGVEMLRRGGNAVDAATAPRGRSVSSSRG